MSSSPEEDEALAPPLSCPASCESKARAKAEAEPKAEPALASKDRAKATEPSMAEPSAKTEAEPKANATANQQAPMEGSEQQLRSMKVGDLKRRALGMGCEQEAIAGADDQEDPKNAVIQLILAKTPEQALPNQLRSMKVGDLKRKALAMGCEQEAIAGADDQDDPKQFVIDLILAKEATELGVEQKLRFELKDMKVGDLKRKALAMGCEQEAIDGADDQDNPKQFVIDLILANKAPKLGAERQFLADLKDMNLGDLKRKALGMGCEQEAIDRADYKDDPKQVVMELILAKKAPELGAEQQLLAKLKDMKLGDVKSKALGMGCDPEAIERADYEPDPKRAVINVILAKKASPAEQHRKRQDLFEKQAAGEEAPPEVYVVASAPEWGFEGDGMENKFYVHGTLLSLDKMIPNIEVVNCGPNDPHQCLDNSDWLKPVDEEIAKHDDKTNDDLLKILKPMIKGTEWWSAYTNAVQIALHNHLFFGANVNLVTIEGGPISRIEQEEMPLLKEALLKVEKVDESRIRLVHFKRMHEFEPEAWAKLAPLDKDPRWDRIGLQNWLTQHHIKLVTVGFVRDLHTRGQTFPHYSKLPSDEWKRWTSEDDGNLYVFTHLSHPDAKLGHHPDEHGALLEYLCKSLDTCGALDHDLLFEEYMSMDSPEWNHSQDRVVRWSPEDRKNRRTGMREIYRLFTYAGIHHIVKRNPDYTDDQLGMAKVWRNKWLEMDMVFSLYCQMLCSQISVECDGGLVHQTSLATLFQKPAFGRTDIVDAGEGEDIAADLDKELVDAILICSNLANTAPAPRLMREWMKMFGKVVGAMASPTDDVDGFKFLCERSGVVWLTVKYLEELAVQKGPYPRQQELNTDAGCIHVGVPPEDALLFVASHCWDSEFHPNPSGEKLQRLLRTVRGSGAKDTDLVFMDHLSLAQRSRLVPVTYFKVHGIKGPQRPRTPKENDQFHYFMHDMSRLFSYKRCHVVILPERGDPSKFPESPTAWGMVSDRGYEDRGWCVNEYAIAKHHGRIINDKDPDVLHVDRSRLWPTQLAQYRAIMNEKTAAGEFRVTFTMKGDKKNAMLNFFRYCFNLLAQDARAQTRTRSPTGQSAD